MKVCAYSYLIMSFLSDGYVRLLLCHWLLLLHRILTFCFLIQLMGYLSGTSPHIKSGAVSVLSLLIYKDTDICHSLPDLIPSLLSLLQGKSVEVIKVSI